MTHAHPRATPSLLRQMHARQVLAALQQNGPMSRADLTRHTGISGPTVTRTVSDLLEANLLEEGEPQQAALGRPGKVLRLASTTVAVLGIVVAPECCEIVSAGLDGQIHAGATHQLATPARYPDLVAALADDAERLIEQSKPTVLGVGVSVPGLLNRREKRTMVSPNLHQMDGRQLGDDLARRLGLDVTLLQESHALCLAERTYGAARGVADFAMLDISSGLGLGVVHHGQIISGHNGLAGELGHLTVELHGKQCGCGNHGCLETVATDTALAAAVSERVGRKLSIDDVVRLVHADELRAEDLFERVLQYLAVGLAAVINIFNPSKLFVYGRFLDADASLSERLVELTRSRALAPSMADCDIIRARGNKRLGAVAGIIDRLTTGRDDPLE